jgi:DNA-binding transcriptional LysR family regulator
MVKVGSRLYTRAMKFSQLKALVAVARGGSFSEASLELNQSQSSVSEAVAGLESELGVRLLERGRFGARPTALGEKVLERAREVLGSIEAIEQEVALEQGQVSGVVRVVTFRSVASQILAPLMVTLKRRFPKVQLRFEEGSSFYAQLTTRLEEGSADLVFVTEQNPAFMGWEMLNDPFYALFPEDGSSVPTSITLESLRPFSLVLSSDGDCGLRLEQHYREHGLALQGAVKVREDDTLIQMVAQGLGVGILPRLAVEHATHIRKVPIFPALERRIYVQVRHGALRLPSVRAFLHLLAEQFPQSEIPCWNELELQYSP